MRRVLALAALVLVTAAASCAHAPAGGKAQVLSLDEGQSAKLDGGGKILFANVVNDSRCPTGAQCIWAGTATARFQMVADGGDTTDVLAVLPGGASKEDTGSQLPVDTLGVSITLLELTPYPIAGQAHSEGRSRALVRVAPLAP